jgi:hypothetical protein
VTREAVSLASERWHWSGGSPERTSYLGRECVRVGTTTATLADVELEDGAIELELAVGPERGFHGVVWRVRDDENYESFFVRPHQVGNPDAVQYTPVFNGLGGFQIYHGPGYWADTTFPIGDWFRIRVAFAGPHAEVYVADLEEPALVVPKLKQPVEPGRVGIVAGGIGNGPFIHLAEFGYTRDVEVHALPGSAPAPLEGAIASWSVSDPFPEGELAASIPNLDRDLVEARTGRPSPPSRPGSWTSRARPASATDGTRCSHARRSTRTGRRRGRWTLASATAPSSS